MIGSKEPSQRLEISADELTDDRKYKILIDSRWDMNHTGLAQPVHSVQKLRSLQTQTTIFQAFLNDILGIAALCQSEPVLQIHVHNHRSYIRKLASRLQIKTELSIQRQVVPHTCTPENRLLQDILESVIQHPQDQARCTQQGSARKMVMLQLGKHIKLLSLSGYHLRSQLTS